MSHRLHRPESPYAHATHQKRHRPHLETLEHRVHLSGSAGCGCPLCQSAAHVAQQVSESNGTAAAPIVQPLTIAASAEKTAKSIWQPLSGIPTEQARQQSFLNPTSYTPFGINVDLLQQHLWSAPMEFTSAGRARPLVLSLPTPDGTTQRFAVQESPIMAPALQAQFPEIRTFIAQGVDQPGASARLDLTPQGFHAQVLSPDGAWYIDPYIHTGARDGAYVSYYKRDQDNSDRGAYIKCETKDLVTHPVTMQDAAGTATGTTLRTYDLAVSTTGEYTSFHGGTATLGLAAVTTVVNRLNGIFETDLTIRMQLVPNNISLIYTNASTDPFTSPNNASTTNSQNQTTIDSVIGSANYDIGHVFHRGSNNGLAGGIGTVGRAGLKAQGFSATTSPINDPFTVDYVAHEMGHQFGARHTFSNCSGGPGDSGALAVEPGSGSTIMAYAGICGGTNIQNNSDAMFHSLNLDQIMIYVSSGPGFTSATRTATGNTPPTVDGGVDYTIPANTSFELFANATDPDGDTLSYSWEQRDGAGSVALNSDPGFGPIIRARGPSASDTRVFPRIQNLLANVFATGEILPTTNRSMNFTVMVRDNRAGGGGVNTDDVVLTVNNTGAAFAVTNFNSFTTVPGGSMQTITWNVAGTSGGTINAANVNISMSIDGGFTYPIMLASNTSNDGSETVQMPFDTGSSAVRFKVKAANNVFFDINNINLAITNVPGAAVPAQPMLESGSDTGVSSTDGITRLNNSSAASVLSFTVGNTVPGALVRIFYGNTEIGSATAAGSSTVVSTNGSTVIPDGTHLITARQTPPGGSESGASLAQSLTIDTAAPTLVGTPTFTFASLPHKVDFAFSENLSATLDVSDLQVFNNFTSTTIANGDKAVTNGAGNAATLTFPGFANGANGAIEDGRFVLTFDGAGLTDVAGNPIANPTFDFFFLNGDANRDATVGIGDFSILAAEFNQTPRLWGQGDFNYNGTVEIGDFSILAAKFNLSLPPATTARAAISPAVKVASAFSAQLIRYDSLDELTSQPQPV